MHASRGEFFHHEWSIRANQPNGVAQDLARTFCFRAVNGPGHDCLRDIAQTIRNTAQPLAAYAPSDLMVPMLLWSTRQPWANTINWNELRKNWALTFAVPGTGMAAHVRTAVSGIALTKDLFAKFGTERSQRHLLDFWLETSREGVWRGVSYMNLPEGELTALYTAWLALLTLTNFEDAESRANPPVFSTTSNRQLQWNGLVIQAMRETDRKGQKQYMETVFASDLRVDTKLFICRFVVAEHWMDPHLQENLFALMPNQEKDRLPYLHWFGFDRSQGEAHIAAMNQQLLAAYCPSFLGVASTLATPADWVSVTKMGNLARAMANAAILDPELALPIDCFE